MSFITPAQIAVHPLVLLSIVDHYQRCLSSSTSNSRVLGALLGTWSGSTLHITNSFAVPFQEDANDNLVFFLDADYMESMHELYKKVQAKERLVGWYHSGQSIQGSDQVIHSVFKRFITGHPVLVVTGKDGDAGKWDGYVMQEEEFVHVKGHVEGEEAEEVGVEHLLRDVGSTATGHLSSSLASKVDSLGEFDSDLGQIVDYLNAVIEGRLPQNHQLIFNLQSLLNERAGDDRQGFVEECNDRAMLVYLGELTKSILTLDDLIENKRAMIV